MQLLTRGLRELLFGESKTAVHADGILDELQVDLEDRGQLGNGCVLVDRHKDFVKEGFKVITQHAIHHKP